MTKRGHPVVVLVNRKSGRHGNNSSVPKLARNCGTG